jgi:hypothetical protein
MTYLWLVFAVFQPIVDSFDPLGKTALGQVASA